VNIAYKHLDSKLRIAELTVGQWMGLCAGVLTGIAYAFYLRPFGTTLTLLSAVYVGGLPVCAVFMANLSDFDVWLLVRSCARWRRLDGHYLPGPGPATAGYRVTVDDDPLSARPGQLAALDLPALWGER
jgi:hypothetical protein